MAQELAALAPRAGVRVVAVGVGPVEAAAGTARALAGGRVRAVINAGIAGGFRGRCAVGDAAIVAVEHYVELGLEDGSAFPLPGGLALARRIDADPALTALAAGAAPAARRLGGLTSATVTATDARATTLAQRFDAGVESMEGFAVLRAAALAGVPAIELRGISNVVGDRASNQWDFRAGAAAAVATTTALLDVLQ